MLIKEADGIEPIHVSVSDASKLLGVSKWSIYQLCNEQEVESVYFGKRRLVVLESLRDYAKNLPREAAS